MIVGSTAGMHPFPFPQELLRHLTVKKRAEPERWTSIDSSYRAPMPREMRVEGGKPRVYLTCEDCECLVRAARGQGSSALGRIRRNGFAPLVGIRRKPRPGGP